jgi:DNA-binding NtrC family response regulator
MLEVEVNLLIVDNDPSIRFSLCQIFRHMGHSVRTAEDGFHALQEMNAETPDVLVSDLNMPRMSGFELLSVVRRRFPAIFVVGMTGAFVDRLPEGIAADAYYRKATGIQTLMELIETGAKTSRISLWAARKSAPIWVPAVASRASRAKQVFIGCPECLRAFPQEAEECDSPQEISCFYCQAPISFAVVA